MAEESEESGFVDHIPHDEVCIFATGDKPR